MATKPKPLRVHSAGLPTPPEHLTEEAKTWWTRYCREYGINDEAGLMMLRAALEAFDRAEEARVILKKEGLVSTDKYGQRKPHPAVGIERDAKKNMLAYLKALNLDVEPILAPGRPPGRR